MMRKKPTTHHDVIGPLDMRPEDSVAEYFASKKNENYFIKLPAEDGGAGDPIQIIYVHSCREHEEMLKLQQSMLESTLQQSKVNATRIRKMYHIQERLHKRFIEVNGFIKDSVDKKRTADKTINEQKQMQEELRGNIETYKKSVEELQTFRNELKATVKEFEPYEKVLDDVVQMSKIFESPKDCMDRCDALMLAQVEISKLEQSKLQEIEEMRLKMISLTNAAALTVLGLKNDLSRLERSYNESRAMCLKWEKILEDCKETIVANTLEKQLTVEGVQCLANLLCNRRGISKHFVSNNIEEQMDFIKKEVEIINEVLKEFENGKETDKVVTSTAGEGEGC